MLALGAELYITAKEAGFEVCHLQCTSVYCSCCKALFQRWHAAEKVTPWNRRIVPRLQGVMTMAEQLLEEDPSLVFTKQFDNAANPAVHFLSTGPEIWAQTQGKVDIFLAGVGTGGTVTGISLACAVMYHAAQSISLL